MDPDHQSHKPVAIRVVWDFRPSPNAKELIEDAVFLIMREDLVRFDEVSE
jgi:hypothetical protein